MKKNLFKEKWKIFEETILTNNWSRIMLPLRKIVKLNKYVEKNWQYLFSLLIQYGVIVNFCKPNFIHSSVT